MKRYTAIFALLVSASALAQTTGGGTNPNPVFNSVDIGPAATNVTGRLTLSETIKQTGTSSQNEFGSTLRATNAVGLDINRNGGSYISFNDVTSEYGFFGRTDIASGGGVSGTSLGLFAGNSRALTFGNYTGGFGFKVMDFAATTGNVGFYTDSWILNPRATSTAFAKIVANTRASLMISDDDHANYICNVANGSNYYIMASVAGTDCNSGTPVLSIASLGSGVDNVSLVAGTGPSDKLSLSGSLLDLTANNGVMNISAGGAIQIGGGTGTYLACSGVPCTTDIYATGSGSTVTITAASAGGVAKVIGDTITLDDHAGTHTAVATLNNSAICTQATGCPGGASRTWQNVAASRAFNTDYTNSSGGEIMVNVAATCNSTNGQNLVVNGVTVGVCSNNVSTGECSISAIVPDGATYRYNGSTASQFVFAEYRP